MNSTRGDNPIYWITIDKYMHSNYSQTLHDVVDESIRKTNIRESLIYKILF